MTLAVLLICSTAFAESKTLASQIILDQGGFSCNTIDGCWGAKSERAARHFLGTRAIGTFVDPERLYDTCFEGKEKPFRVDTVTTNELASLVTIPAEPADKAKLPHMGFESIQEMYAERGHMSQRALARLNPEVDWANIRAGQRIVLPNFPSVESMLAAKTTRRPATHLRISLSRFEIVAYDASGSCLGVFPCSIARDKAKRPPKGELAIATKIANPNYTFTPDFTPQGQKPKKHILAAGPNCPVGVAWLGLNLPTYGIHGTPRPETIGNAESHGCFRLSNWNIARLYAMCRVGTKVIIEP